MGFRKASFSATYRNDHRSITATVTTDEHAAFLQVAAAAGMKPSTYAAKLVREAIAWRRVQLASSSHPPADDTPPPATPSPYEPAAAPSLAITPLRALELGASRP